MTVFVLGAGASKFAGYPLALDLWAFVRDSSHSELMAERRRADSVAAIERVLEVVPPVQHDRPDLEVIFTLLDLTDTNMQHHLALSSFSWRDIRPKLVGAIADAFQWHEYLLQKSILEGAGAPAGVDSILVRDVLAAWTERVRPGDVVVSFNWDLLHEAALWRANRWDYSNGYGFSTVPWRRSPTTVLKLHGSVNWAQHDEHDARPAIHHKADFFRGAVDEPGTYMKGASDWGMGRRLIIPSYLKDISSNALLLSIWNLAADALIAADEWVVIGHLLNPADAAARQLFGQCLVRRKSRTTRVAIVAPDVSPYWPSFATSLRAKVERVKKTFEEHLLS
jgi:hypothetical protein